MFETVKKADRQSGEQNGYDLGRDGKKIQKKSRSLKDDVRVNMKPVMQLQAVYRQAVIQMAPYDDYLKYLQSVKGEDLTVLCEHLQQYIVCRTAYENGQQGADRKRALANLLKMALDISKAANAIKQNLPDSDPPLTKILENLEKFVHVELLPNETMSLDDLSDILDQTRALVNDEWHSSGQEGMRGEDRIRELGLLSVTDGEARQKLVLMINGGGILEGTGGSVTAPGETTPVFENNWSDVRFIAHTHPNQLGFQTDKEFDTDVKVLKSESGRRRGLEQAEMVRRDRIGGGTGVGGTIFYTGNGVLSEKNEGQYKEGFAVRADNLNNILDQNKREFLDRLTPQQQQEYERFVETFVIDIRQKMGMRDDIVNNLMRETLSAAGFLELEQQLAQLSRDNPEIFDASRLRSKFCEEYWRQFPKPQMQEDDLDDIFDLLKNGINFDTEEEDAK